MNILELLKGPLGGMAMDALSQQVGSDRQTTETAAQSAVSALLGAISKNASTPQGANALVSALDLDHDGSVLDDFADLINGKKQVANASTLNGAGILKHILGGKQGSVEQLISGASGMDKSAASKLLPMLAPLVMGALGKARRQGNLDISGLSKSVEQTVKSPENESIQMKIAKQFLDKDGDGSILDDLAGMGMKAFFNR